MKKTVVLISKYNNYLESVKYSFKNVIELDGEVSLEERDKLINEIEKFDNVILIDYIYVYRYLLQNVEKNYKWIITFDISCLSMLGNKLAYKTLMEYYDRKLVNEIAVLDDNLYELLKKSKYNVSKISFDINKKFKKVKNDSVGVIGHDYDPLDNYYNVLTAVKLANVKVNYAGKTNATKNFIDFFDMNSSSKENDYDVIKSSSLVVAASFANLNIENILIAMDNGVIAIVGNTSLFDKYKKLKNYLVLNSDDDVNEISLKLSEAKKHSKEIFEEYKRFRKEFSNESLKQIKSFIA